MGAATPDPGRMRATKSVNRRALVLGLMLLALSLTLVGQLATGRYGTRHDPMHGDGEDAMAALDSALNRMPGTARLAYLLKSVDDPSPGLRYAAVDALAHYRSPEAAGAIEHAFKDSASIVRQRAAETLHTVDRERGTLLLLAALRDEDTWIREAAVAQLAMRVPQRGPEATLTAEHAAGRQPDIRTGKEEAPLADKRAVATLIRALDDDDDVVTRQAAGLLLRLTDRGSAYRTMAGPAGRESVIKEWKSWWAGNAGRYASSPAFADVQAIRPERSDPAPDFSLPDIEGRPISLSAQRGRVTLLNFWGTWCPPCRVEIPDLERLHENYAASGLDVIGAAVGESHGTRGLKAWCAEHGLQYRQALATPELQEAYGDVHEVPVSVLIDKQGRIRYRWEGERGYSTFQAGVTRLLAE